MSLLEVRNLAVTVTGEPTDLLRDVSFDVKPGEIHGLVGESGSGKTITSLAIMGLLPLGIELRAGSVKIDGKEIVDTTARTVRHQTGDMAMIFQEPRSALNPTMRVGAQIARVLRINQGLTKSTARRQAIDLLARVGIPGPDRVAVAYPHQLSGGMCQRVMISMALSCRPRLLIADEPTTALDVTIQAQIFDLIQDLVAETGSGVLFITHDLAAVAEMCDRVTVLYGGQVMESGSVGDVLTNPQHPYTQFLLDAVEREVDPRIPEKGVNFRLQGCRFGHRCPYAYTACAEFPTMTDVGPQHRAACFLREEESHATGRT